MRRPRRQRNTEVEATADRRKYEIGRRLTFRSYDPDEVHLVPCRTFQRGDVLKVRAQNGGGMGILVVRLSDGRVDMVWPTEVSVRRQGAKAASAQETP